jgi:hypothetical protein
MFLIRAALILLDFEGEKFDQKKMKDYEKEWANKDPGAAIKHARAKKPTSFKKGHPFHKISQDTQLLYKKVVDARHNLIYRPYFEARENSWHWEDCELEDLLKNIPSVNEVEQVYNKFYDAIKLGFQTGIDNIFLLFKVSLSLPLSTPPLTLLLNYARLLDSASASNLDLHLLDEIRKYRNQLLDEVIEEKFLDTELKKLATK